MTAIKPLELPLGVEHPAAKQETPAEKEPSAVTIAQPSALLPAEHVSAPAIDQKNTAPAAGEVRCSADAGTTPDKPTAVLVGCESSPSEKPPERICLQIEPSSG